ncbi:MAG TPA: sigma-70 family RNA polymerase sigma factor [Nocardioidaceae bacterium]|nr:sigma-70 family RNA polymerase sigma factor [Nocardioidaceae bacterium]
MTELLRDVETPSDAELISRVRGGDVAAYGELFTRHQHAATRLARQLVRGPDSDDLVSEAFAKMLTLLQSGGGPDVAFRAYLLTAVRRLHIDRIRSSSRLQTTDDMAPFDPGVPFLDTAVAGFENGAAARAFASLPERWQLVLWHLEVEGQKPAEVAPLLGMSPNSVSALAYRAREGLRQAFLTMHLADIPDTDCRWVTEHLGAYVRKGLSKRDAGKVEGHLESCRRCTAMYLELDEVNSNLAGILAPLLLGAAAAGYVASGAGGAAGALGSLSLAKAKALVLAHSGAAAAAGAAATVAAASVAVAVAVGVGGGDGDRTVLAEPPAGVTWSATPPPSSTTPTAGASPSPSATAGSRAAATPGPSPSASAPTGLGATPASPEETVPPALLLPFGPPVSSGPSAPADQSSPPDPPGSPGSPGPSRQPTPSFTQGPGGVVTQPPVTDPPVTEPPAPPHRLVEQPVLSDDGTVTVSVRNLRADDLVDVVIGSAETRFPTSLAVPGCAVAAPGHVTCGPAGSDRVLDYSVTLPLAFPAHMVSDDVDLTVSVDGAAPASLQQSFRPARVPTYDFTAPSLDHAPGSHTVAGDEDRYQVTTTAVLPPRVTGLVYVLRGGGDGTRFLAGTWRRPSGGTASEPCTVSESGRTLTCAAVRDEDKVELSLSATSLRTVTAAGVSVEPVDAFRDPRPGDTLSALSLTPGADLGLDLALVTARPGRDALVQLAGSLTGARAGLHRVVYTVSPGARFPARGNVGCSTAADTLSCPVPSDGAVALTVAADNRNASVPLTVSVEPVAPFEAVGTGPHADEVTLTGRPMHDYSLERLTGTGHRVVRIDGAYVDRRALSARVGPLPPGETSVAFQLTEGGAFAVDQPDARCRLSTAPDTGGLVLCEGLVGDEDVSLLVDSTSAVRHDVSVRLLPLGEYDDVDDRDAVATASGLRPGTALVVDAGATGPRHADPDGSYPVSVTVSGIRPGLPGVRLELPDGLVETSTRGCTVTGPAVDCVGLADGDRVELAVRPASAQADPRLTVTATPGGEFVDVGATNTASMLLVPHHDYSLGPLRLAGQTLSGDTDRFLLTGAVGGLPEGQDAVRFTVTGDGVFSADQAPGCVVTGDTSLRCAGPGTGADTGREVTFSVDSTSTSERSLGIALVVPDGYDDLDPTDNARTATGLRPGVDLRLAALDPDNESPTNDDDRHVVATRLTGVRAGLGGIDYTLEGDASFARVSGGRCEVTGARTVTCTEPKDGPLVFVVTAADVRATTAVRITAEPADPFTELDRADNSAATRLAPRPTYDFGLDGLSTARHTVRDGVDHLRLATTLRSVPDGVDGITLRLRGATFTAQQEPGCAAEDATLLRCTDLATARAVELAVTSTSPSAHDVELTLEVPSRYDDPDLADNTADVRVTPGVDLVMGPLSPADPVPTAAGYSVSSVLTGVRSGPVTFTTSGGATFADSSCAVTGPTRVTCADPRDGQAVSFTLRPDRPAARTTVTVRAVAAAGLEELDGSDNAATASLAPDVVLESVRVLRARVGSHQSLVRAQVAGVPAGSDTLRIRLTGGTVGNGPGQVHLADGALGADGEGDVDCHVSDAAGRGVVNGDWATCTRVGVAPEGRFFVDLRVAHPQGAGTVTVTVVPVGADEGPHAANNSRALTLGSG